MRDALGVFLYLPPGLEGLELRGQGLVRNAVTTAVALAREGDQSVVLVAPHAFRDQLTEAIASLSFGTAPRLELVSPRSLSPAGRLARALHHRQAQGGRRRRWRASRERTVRVTTATIQWALAGWSRVLLSLLLMTLMAALLAVALVWLSWMVPARLGVLLAVALVVVTICAWWARRHRGTIRALTTRATRQRSRERSTIGTALERADVRHLVRRANRCKVSAWWCPSTLFGDVEFLRAPRVSTFADFSPAEFPFMIHDEPRFIARRREMARAIHASTVVVCLSEHVLRRHLPLVDPAAVTRALVIPPGPPTRGADLAGPSGARQPTPVHASEFIREIRPTSRAATAGWWDFPVITAPTQARPYKNLRSLIRAIRVLNVKHNLRARLILTARPGEDGIGAFIKSEGCSPYVEFLSNIPEDALEAVLAASHLGITASLFEGSLPYTLHESVSVGTPCLMANIPVTRAASAHDPRFQELTLFDPYDPEKIADAIQRGLTQLPELLECQREFLAQREEQYGWQQTAARYLQILNQVSSTRQGAL